LTGIAPVNDQQILGSTSGATCDVNVTITERPLSFPWCGASTGSSIIGAYGFGIKANQLTASDKLFDLGNNQRIPPNNVQFTVGGLVNTEDRVLVTALAYYFAYDGGAGGPFTDGETLTFSGGATMKLLVALETEPTGTMVARLLTGTLPVDDETFSGGASSASGVLNGAMIGTIDIEQLTLAAELNGVTTTVTVSEVIPTDTPTTGTIRILRANGVYSRHPYSAYSSAGKTFTITSHDFTGNIAASGNGVFISYLDDIAAGATMAFSSVYLADRSLFIRVRDGAATPIKTFETTGVLGSAGGSSTAIRTSDT
jgi:hypothetical protein